MPGNSSIDRKHRVDGCDSRAVPFREPRRKSIVAAGSMTIGGSSCGSRSENAYSVYSMVEWWAREATRSRARKSTGRSRRAAPSITNLVADKSPILSGSPTTLTAIFGGGIGVVDNGVGLIVPGISQSTSNLTFTTTFTLTVTNVAGDKVMVLTTVNVLAPGTFTLTGDLAEPETLQTATGFSPVPSLFHGGPELTEDLPVPAPNRAVTESGRRD